MKKEFYFLFKQRSDAYAVTSKTSGIHQIRSNVDNRKQFRQHDVGYLLNQCQHLASIDVHGVEGWARVRSEFGHVGEWLAKVRGVHLQGEGPCGGVDGTVVEDSVAETIVEEVKDSGIGELIGPIRVAQLVDWS
ncbi:hypothetical protein COCNU_07G014900 [Cocos nucifera]|uniref:Uncharacterized protein n=1 Tax=Cocos nucifera TaxID=13894 RepID=A0A8K0IHR7_COCNU|nr:hypothetical protein COCNU_07G014900 [Cocos nucifera]